jgi:hypothetical protein
LGSTSLHKLVSYYSDITTQAELCSQLSRHETVELIRFKSPVTGFAIYAE